MIGQKMMMRLAVLFLLLGTTMAWSKRMHKSRPAAEGSQVAAAESKVHHQYSEEPKAAESSYGLHEGHAYPKDHGHSEEYVDSEDQKSVKENDEAQGNEESDDTIKDDAYDEHSEKGGVKEFKAGGLSFDKHLKDHKADNKEIENVKQHDMGSKFGGESTKEHKLGKHKEKSKGHKLHGFKNVYHKEEYGDHKTFHDEFLDSDHHHNYDDHHEHEEMQGGKFSKGFKHEGKNNKYDKGDEKHEWGKQDFDGHYEGKHEKGGNKSKHRHATKKHQGHYDADAQRQKNSVHKVQKGVPPPPPISYPAHGGHHGPHQAQIQPYVSHYNSHHEQVNVPSHNYKPHSHHHSHQSPYDSDKHGSGGDHGSHYHNHDDHHGNHGDHHHKHGGHHDNDNSDESYSKDSGHDNDYHERTAQNHQHRSSGKESEDKNDEKFVPIVKHEPVARKHEPIPHKHEPAVRTYEPIIQKQEPYTYKNQPHTHHHHSHAHKQSVSPNYGIQQYRQPVYQENSHFRPSQPIRQEKFSERFNDRSPNHNQGIRYGFQPRNHHHNHNNRFHHNFNSRYHQQQPFPRFPGFNHQANHHQANHQSHGHHNHHHHHHGNHKNHNHFRHAPSHYQQESKPEIHSPKVEDTPVKPTRDESHHRISQKHYE